MTRSSWHGKQQTHSPSEATDASRDGESISKGGQLIHTISSLPKR